MIDFLAKLKKSGLPLEQALDMATEYFVLNSLKDPLRNIDRTFLHYPPGHFLSPLPDRAELERVRKRAADISPNSVPGVDLREREQLKLYAQLVKYYSDFPFQEEQTPNLRYYLNNNFFCHADAFWLYALLRHFQPKRLIEIGSGFSSCVTLDTWEKFLTGPPNLTFIEPHPERLLQLMEDVGDKKNITLIEKIVQDVQLDIFDELEEGDVLFIDNSHVGKIGSDVLHCLFEVLPRLQSGVLVHFHDIFYPFEYPAEWLDKGWAWNEDYFLRAFLQYNNAFEILLFGHFLGRNHYQMLQKHTPICCKNIGGSLWLRKK